MTSLPVQMSLDDVVILLSAHFKLLLPWALRGQPHASVCFHAPVGQQLLAAMTTARAGPVKCWRSGRLTLLCCVSAGGGNQPGLQGQPLGVRQRGKRAKRTCEQNLRKLPPLPGRNRKQEAAAAPELLWKVKRSQDSRRLVRRCGAGAAALGWFPLERSCHLRGNSRWHGGQNGAAARWDVSSASHSK